MTKYRDIQLIIKDEDSYLAIACDVSAAIGNKEHDVVKVDNEVVGYYAAAVPIIELLSIGAVPISVVNTLGVEMVSTGEEIIKGILKAMDDGHIKRNCLTGSTEDNMPTLTTSVGVTVIGDLQIDLLDRQQPQSGQGVYLIGLPKFGQEFVDEEVVGSKNEVITIALVKHLRAFKQVGHLLPIGSKGILYELSTLLELNDLRMDYTDDITIDLRASAGPATCMIMTCWPEDSQHICQTISQPVQRLGSLK